MRKITIVFMVLLVLAASIPIYLYLFREEIEGEVSTPVFELPIANKDVDRVTGVQAFHNPRSSELHVGFDFVFSHPTEILSPIDGEITNVHKHQMSNGYWLVDVNIRINRAWSMFIAFEPYTQDETEIDRQLEKIVVKIGDQVKQGQLLGVLDANPDRDFCHIHWSITKDGEHVSPYDYCSEKAKSQMDALCKKFDTQPAY
jgi:hypothetical protein